MRVRPPALALLLLASCGDELVCELSAGDLTDGCPRFFSPAEVYMDFGDVPVGEERSKSFEVRSPTPSTIELGEPGGPFTIEPLTGDVEDGRPATFTVRFTPATAGTFDATSRNRGARAFRALMHGSGVAPP